MNPTVRPATPADDAFLLATLGDAFGGTRMAVHGELLDARGDAAAIAWRDDRPIGLLTYRDDGTGGWEILALAAAEQRSGAGTALLAWIRDLARHRAVTRLWLITTNENVDALRFYQRRGFDLVALHRDAVTRARELKPSIPLEEDGIPLRHELELELRP
ncbi:GNAT family N-acetyltransferase [Actinoplanes sp. NPDC051851]|uniref:GNAT family N-acetyltransferase n=1 Tax=Actinoplanes sp. NPDC051851 TaxID=3154753 RepID=UPI0034353828